METMKTVFLFISRHVFTSDLLRTEYIKYLSQKYRVVVFFPPKIFKDLGESNYYQNSNIIYRSWKIKYRRFWALFNLLRVSCIREFDNLSYFYIREHRMFKTRVSRFLRKLSNVFPKTLTRDFFSRWETFLLPNSRAFKSYCQEYKPSLVLTTTPGFKSYESEAIVLAKKNKIPTVSMNFSWDNLGSMAWFMREPDYLICWNEIIKREAQEIHNYSPNRVFVSGIIRFDYDFKKEVDEPQREEFLRSKNLDPKNKTILISTSSGYYLYNKKYVRDLLDLRESQSLVCYPNIFVRAHPLDDFENYKEFFNVKNLHVEPAADAMRQPAKKGGPTEMSKQDLLNLKYTIMYTDLNLNYMSSIVLQACAFDKPIVNIGFLERYKRSYQFGHFKPLLDTGAVRIVLSSADFKKYINMYLSDPKIDSENRKRAAEQLVPFRDGLSYRRNIDFLEEMSQK